jgi:D-glycero-D-manno-heptose 1,7-bisphosphate phosphatase
MTEAIVFLDKDGTLIEDLPYNVDPRRVRFAPGARDGLRLLARNGWRVAIVTNQSGVARGFFTIDELDGLGRHLAGLIGAEGAQMAGFYACPHLPDGINEFGVECDCRKPAAGLLHQAAAELEVDLGSSWFVGDTWMDVAAGRAAGCRTALVGHEWRHEPESPDRSPDLAAPDLLAVAEWIGRRPLVATGRPS